MTESSDFQQFRDLITVFCRNDRDAINLCESYLQIAHIWDDLVDKDKELSSFDVNKTFMAALGDIPRNPYYQNHVREFSALSLIAAMTWQIANKFESGNDDEKLGSFILRNSLIQLIYFVVLLSGCRQNDDTWGIDIGEIFFREFFKGYNAKYQFFLNEMREKDENHN